MGCKYYFESKKNYTPIVLGEVYLLNNKKLNISQYIVDDVEKEVILLVNAIEKAKQEIIEIKSKINQQTQKDIYAIFEFYQLLLEDDYYLDDAINEIKITKLNAAYVIYSRLQKSIVFFDNIEDSLIKQRKEDIEFIAEKVIFQIVGKDEGNHYSVKNKILVAKNISPIDLIVYYYQNIAGIIIEGGDLTSHTSIIAHSLNLPYMIGVSDITNNVSENDFVIIDGFEGKIFVSPDDEMKLFYQSKQKHQTEVYEKFKDDDIEILRTKDGKQINIFINLSIFEETNQVKNLFFNGVGLFRTEFLFYNQDTIPSVTEQVEIYKKILSYFPNKSVTIRTFDFSEDKTPITLKKYHQHNPALGLRGIRFAMFNDIFKEQFEAIIKASQFGEINILFPMVTSVQEVIEIKKTESEILKSIHHNTNYKIGIMVETPSSVFMLKYIHQFIDFVSFGTNDLMQFFLAIDRGNEYLKKINTPFEISFIDFLNFSLKEAKKYNLKTTICGEIASHLSYIPILIGMGFENISVIPSLIPFIKNLITNITFKECFDFVNSLNTFLLPNEIEKLSNNLVKGF